MGAWTTELREALPPGRVVVDPDIIASSSRDHAAFVPAGRAEALVRATCVDHVVTTLRFANARRIPVVTRAAGNGLSGGANAIDGSIILSVAAMDRILELDPRSRLAVVEPGVLGGRLAAAADEAGLYYAPDPASREISTIEGRMLLAARRLALPALEKLGTTLLDDVAVPKPQLVQMMRRCEQVAARHGVTIGTFGHAGDGNLHPTIVFDAHDEASVAAARRAFDDLLTAALELGGTITGEHGVGLLKRDTMSRMMGETERELMGRVKAAFDPNGILNPGKGF